MMISRQKEKGFTSTPSLLSPRRVFLSRCRSTRHDATSGRRDGKNGAGAAENTRANLVRGFTLIEFIVAVAIFVVVVLIAAGALLSIIEANRKTQSSKSVINNLNFALEGMSRSIRVGTDYSGGGSTITFLNSEGDTVTYRRQGTVVEREIAGGGFTAMTAPEVIIDRLNFFIDGEDPSDQTQPSVIIVLQGHVGTDPATRTDFSVQTLVSQRLVDG